MTNIGLIWVAECIVVNGLEKWKEGNLGTSFKIGEGLVGRVVLQIVYSVDDNLHDCYYSRIVNQSGLPEEIL